MGASVRITQSVVGESATTYTIRYWIDYYGNGLSWNNGGASWRITCEGQAAGGACSISKSQSWQNVGSGTFTVGKSSGGRTIGVSGYVATGVSIGTLWGSTSTWVPAITAYTVTFNNSNVDTNGSPVPEHEKTSNVSIQYGSNVTFPNKSITGYKLLGWKTDGDSNVYAPQSTYTITGPKTFTEVLEAQFITINMPSSNVTINSNNDNLVTIPTTFFFKQISTENNEVKNSSGQTLNAYITQFESEFKSKVNYRKITSYNLLKDGTSVLSQKSFSEIRNYFMQSSNSEYMKSGFIGGTTFDITANSSPEKYNLKVIYFDGKTFKKVTTNIASSDTTFENNIKNCFTNSGEILSDISYLGQRYKRLNKLRLSKSEVSYSANTPYEISQSHMLSDAVYENPVTVKDQAVVNMSNYCRSSGTILLLYQIDHVITTTLSDIKYTRTSAKPSKYNSETDPNKYYEDYISDSFNLINDFNKLKTSGDDVDYIVGYIKFTNEIPNDFYIKTFDANAVVSSKQVKDSNLISGFLELSIENTIYNLYPRTFTEAFTSNTKYVYMYDSAKNDLYIKFYCKPEDLSYTDLSEDRFLRIRISNAKNIFSYTIKDIYTIKKFTGLHTLAYIPNNKKTFNFGYIPSVPDSEYGVNTSIPFNLMYKQGNQEKVVFSLQVITQATLLLTDMTSGIYYIANKVTLTTADLQKFEIQAGGLLWVYRYENTFSCKIQHPDLREQYFTVR